jgi:alkylation response protein AidB-like acyl-CoA dehydrogenase
MERTMIDRSERNELQDMLRKFFGSHSPESAVRTAMASATGIDEDLWRRLGDNELGVLGLHVPVEHGGAGHGIGELAVVLTEAGRSLACVPLLSSAVLATTALLRSGDDAACGRWLPAMVSGTARAALAVHEPNRSWDVHHPACIAVGTEDRWTVTGTKTYVIDGAGADVLIVSASTPDGTRLFAVDPGGGVAESLMPALDQTRRLATLTFNAAPATPLGAPGGADDVLDHVMRIACVALAAEQIGAAEAVLATASEYARTRIQFGRAIGSFQAVKHRCADMLVAVSTARSVAMHAVMAADTGDDLPTAAAMAKSYCSQAFFDVAAANIQVHGGIGFTWEHSAHLYFKRAKSDALLFGDAAAQRATLATLLGVG